MARHRSTRLSGGAARGAALRCLAFLSAVVLCAGCASRTGLATAVLDYDEVAARADARMLLLNVARARYGRPLHFSAVSGIAATFELEGSVGAGGEIAEAAGVTSLAPQVGLRVVESPTISIVPIRGEDFTRRLLAPFDAATFGFFYHQGSNVATLCRMLCQGLYVEENGTRVSVPNPVLPGESGRFADFVARLEALDAEGTLDIGPLVFEQSYMLDEGAAVDAGTLSDVLDRGYALQRDRRGVRLLHRVAGRQAITDYLPSELSSEALIELERSAASYPESFVLIDLRGETDGRPPLRGWLKLRSLGGLIDTLALSVDADASDSIRVVGETPADRSGALAWVEYEGEYYVATRPQAVGATNEFRLLARLYQLAVTEVPGAALPSLTIAK